MMIGLITFLSAVLCFIGAVASLCIEKASDEG